MNYVKFSHLMLAILPVLLLTPLAAAQSAGQDADVQVGVYILNVGKFDVATGSFTVDFYLDMKCETECDPGRFEFTNGRANSVDKIIDEPNEKFYRIQASLTQNIDLRKYPFDVHNLSIVIEDKVKTIDELRYSIDPQSTGMDAGVYVIGWELGRLTHEATEHYYPPYDETYSTATFSIEIGRVFLTSVMKLLPVFFMVLVGMLSLMLAADKVTMRLSLNISTLLAAVMFHLNLTSAIPPVGYLTLADKFMIMTYVILIAIMATGIALMRHTEKKDKRKADLIYKWSLYTMPPLAAILYAIIFLLQ